MAITSSVLRGKETQGYFDRVDAARKQLSDITQRLILEQTEEGRKVIASQVYELLNDIALYCRMIELGAHGDEDAQMAEEGGARIEISESRFIGDRQIIITEQEIQQKVIERAAQGRSNPSFIEKFGNKPPFGCQSSSL